MTLENHHFQWVNPLEITISNSYVQITRGYLNGNSSPFPVMVVVAMAAHLELAARHVEGAAPTGQTAECEYVMKE